MLKTSTPKTTTPENRSSKQDAPTERTLKFLRQFARSYTAPCAAPALPGIVLN